MLYFEQSPVFGIGWNNFMKMFTLRNTHCHNIYYQLLCETGIVGFSVFIFFFVTRIIGTIKKLNLSIYMEMKEAPWLKLSLFIQVFFLLYGFSGNPLYDIEETILYFFAVGISFLPQDKRRYPLNKEHWLMKLAILTFQFAHNYGALLQAYALKEF